MQIQSKLSRGTLLNEALQPTGLNATPTEPPNLYGQAQGQEGLNSAPKLVGWRGEGKAAVVWEGILGFMKAFQTFCCRTCLILHVVFLSFPQKEVKSWVLSLDNVVHPFICVPLVCDCSSSCSPPALHPSASPQLRIQLWLAKSTLRPRVQPPLAGSPPLHPSRSTLP